VADGGLGAAVQSWWQLLPLGPPDEFDSPYKAASAFAGWRGLLEDPIRIEAEGPFRTNERKLPSADIELRIGSGGTGAFAGDGYPDLEAALLVPPGQSRRRVNRAAIRRPA